MNIPSEIVLDGEVVASIVVTGDISDPVFVDVVKAVDDAGLKIALRHNASWHAKPEYGTIE